MRKVAVQRWASAAAREDHAGNRDAVRHSTMQKIAATGRSAARFVRRRASTLLVREILVLKLANMLKVMHLYFNCVAP